MSADSSRKPVTRSGYDRAVFLVGLLLAIGAPFLYGIQIFVLEDLSVPWYVPILGTIGELLVIAALMRRANLGRIASFLLVGLLASLEWWYLLSFSLLPSYAGPAERGVRLPSFSVITAEGEKFSDADLRDGRITVLLFFRGRW
jgi:hypothetical protein